MSAARTEISPGISIAVVRHGATSATGRTYSGSGRGAADPGLLPAAVENVAAAAAGLGRWVPQGAPRVPLLSSPARRCIETAQALRECGPGWMAASPEASIEPGLAEIDFGRWEGLSAGQAQARDPQLWDRWLRDPLVAAPGGESLTDAARRLAPVLTRLVSSGQPRWLLVGHATTVRLIAATALELPLAQSIRITVPPAGYAVVRLWPDGGGCLDQLSAPDDRAWVVAQ